MVAPTGNRDVLGIKITRSIEEGTLPFHARYERNDDHLGHGSTPYMAVLDLINSYNTSEEWNRQNG